MLFSCAIDAPTLAVGILAVMQRHLQACLEESDLQTSCHYKSCLGNSCLQISWQKLSLQGVVVHLFKGNANAPHVYVTNNRDSQCTVCVTSSTQSTEPFQRHSSCSDMQQQSLHAASRAANSSKACNRHMQHMQHMQVRREGVLTDDDHTTSYTTSNGPNGGALIGCSWR